MGGYKARGLEVNLVTGIIVCEYGIGMPANEAGSRINP